MSINPTVLTLQGGRTLNLSRLVEMYRDEGRSIRAIAKEFRLSTSTVSEHLKKAGIEVGPKGRNRQVNDTYIALTLKMRAEGLHWETIANKIGFDSRVLQRAINRHALQDLMAREAALQARLNDADQRIDELETELRTLRNLRSAA